MEFVVATDGIAVVFRTGADTVEVFGAGRGTGVVFGAAGDTALTVRAGGETAGVSRSKKDNESCVDEAMGRVSFKKTMLKEDKA
jgi:hypothetical protein